MGKLLVNQLEQYYQSELEQYKTQLLAILEKFSKIEDLSIKQIRINIQLVKEIGSHIKEIANWYEGDMDSTTKESIENLYEILCRFERFNKFVKSIESYHLTEKLEENISISSEDIVVCSSILASHVEKLGDKALTVCDFVENVRTAQEVSNRMQGIETWYSQLGDPVLQIKAVEIIGWLKVYQEAQTLVSMIDDKNSNLYIREYCDSINSDNEKEAFLKCLNSIQEKFGNDALEHRNLQSKIDCSEGELIFMEDNNVEFPNLVCFQELNDYENTLHEGFRQLETVESMTLGEFLDRSEEIQGIRDGLQKWYQVENPRVQMKVLALQELLEQYSFELPKRVGNAPCKESVSRESTNISGLEKSSNGSFNFKELYLTKKVYLQEIKELQRQLDRDLKRGVTFSFFRKYKDKYYQKRLRRLSTRFEETYGKEISEKLEKMPAICREKRIITDKLRRLEDDIQLILETEVTDDQELTMKLSEVEWLRETRFDAILETMPTTVKKIEKNMKAVRKGEKIIPVAQEDNFHIAKNDTIDTLKRKYMAIKEIISETTINHTKKMLKSAAYHYETCKMLSDLETKVINQEEFEIISERLRKSLIRKKDIQNRSKSQNPDELWDKYKENVEFLNSCIRKLRRSDEFEIDREAVFKDIFTYSNKYLTYFKQSEYNRRNYALEACGLIATAFISIARVLCSEDDLYVPILETEVEQMGPLSHVSNRDSLDQRIGQDRIEKVQKKYHSLSAKNLSFTNTIVSESEFLSQSDARLKDSDIMFEVDGVTQDVSQLDVKRCLEYLDDGNQQLGYRNQGDIKVFCKVNKV